MFRENAPTQPARDQTTGPRWEPWRKIALRKLNLRCRTGSLHLVGVLAIITRASAQIAVEITRAGAFRAISTDGQGADKLAE
jgi:hypothetical protein